ncbi:MaoC/PaaZ C-terminal domain-containing protein [Rhodococcus pyridinivorans]|uniref:MaoC/PaaZ C-terminal domain-containing protein n=1 Tax=Rhodococcus pyridinivorans TaxID=103816 RepID=UPI00341F1675
MDAQVEQPERTWGDEIVVGSRYEFPEYTIGEEDIIAFAEQWDPQWFHIDPEAAGEGSFGGLIASGVQTIAIFQRLSVLAAFQHWQVIAGRRLRDVQFRRPLRPGTTVSGCLRVVEVESDKPGRALVVVQGELLDDGKSLFTSACEVYVRSRV